MPGANKSILSEAGETAVGPEVKSPPNLSANAGRCRLRWQQHCQQLVSAAAARWPASIGLAVLPDWLSSNGTR